jgi:hypothetical protein
MPATTPPSRLWIHWLSAASAGVVFFGLVLVLAPGLARQGFAWLVYAAPARIDGFGAEAVRYIGLAHAVIGAVMVGWGVAMWLVTRQLLARGLRVGWTLLALSLAAWFVPDTVYSLASGYWPNAVLNSVFAVTFAVPLWATRGVAGELVAASPQGSAEPAAAVG